MKKLIIINGTMGVGKTAVSECLADRLQPSVFLDGDWCWKMNPWIFSEENKKMVTDNITYLLNAYLNNSGFKYIIFCWVIHRPEIFERLLSRLKKEYTLYKISLVCSKEALRAHIMHDVHRGIRTIDQLESSYSRMQLYTNMDTAKIDVSRITVPQAAERIIDMIR